MRGSLKAAFVKAMGRLPFNLWPSSVRGRFIPVFMLHRFQVEDLDLSGHKVNQLVRFFEFLRRKQVDIISLQDAIDRNSKGERLSRPAVAFTIDDGYQDHLEVGLPLFKAHDIPCTFFLPTQIIQKGDWIWDAKLQYLVDRLFEKPEMLPAITSLFDLDSVHGKELFCEALVAKIKPRSPDQVDSSITSIAQLLGLEIPARPTEKYRTIEVSDIQTLENAGMLVGPHSRTHRILTSLDDQAVRAEIAGSWADLQEMASTPLPVFCYPVGKATDFSRREAALVEQCGMRAAVTAVAGSMLVDSPTDLYTLPRYALPDEFEDFVQYSTWIEEVKSMLRRDRTIASQKALP